MYKKTFYFAFIALLITSVIDAKKTRRNKRPRDEEDSTPQPNVVTYSTFGFNDVGSYDGFIPSSPDYTNFIRNFSPESSAPTRLYAPAFPTAMDHEGYSSGFSSQDTQPSVSGPSDDNIPQASMLQQYPQSAVSFYNTPSLESSDPRNQHGVVNELFSQNVGEVNAPIYGTKIGSRNRNKTPNNHTEENLFSSGPSSPMGVKYSTFHEVHSSYEGKPNNFGESDKNYQNHFSYLQTYSPTDSDNAKNMPTSTQSPLKFPRVIDFTKFKQYYPSGAESKVTTTTTKPTTPTSSYNPWPKPSNTNEHGYTNNFEDFRTKFPNPGSSIGESVKEENDDTNKQTQSPLMYTDVDYSRNNYFANSIRDSNKDNKFDVDFKDKFKNKPWPFTNFTENDYKSWKNPFKGYQYSTNASNMTFEFDFSGAKKPTNNNHDEVIPESTNVDISSYQFPSPDYSNFKKIPPLRDSFGDLQNFEEEYENPYHSLKNTKYDPADYVKSLYSLSTVPTTTSHWGNIYKTAEYNSFKHHVKKPQQYFEESNDEIVHIPKRPYSNKYNFGKYSDSKPTSEWSSYPSYRPHKPKKNKESTRFKSEEDLLGLRTHDTSHPSYLPTYRPNFLSNDDYDYKKLVEKWRQSYLKAKYKDFAHDFESYSSEPKPIHVPVPKPYPIEVPHPVIVPVPQPYPVRVPVPKPVAVPIVQELTVPVEKPVPYPVVKNVPYPVEKYVPVRVEKEVKVPVMKPYPVPIPHIRPVFHHTRHRDRDEEENVEEEEEYGSRPESSKKVPYAKRIKHSSTRTRSRRPTRTYLQPHHTHPHREREPHSYREREREERNRRRWPSRQPSLRAPELRYPKRSPAELRPQPFRPSEDVEEQEYEPEYSSAYCKKTGNC